LPEPQDRLTVPYTFFKQQVASGNVSKITSRGEDIQGVFKQPVADPAAPSPPAGQAPQTYSKFATIKPAFDDPELLPLLEQLRRLGVRIIALAGARDSTLCRLADVTLDAAVREEACPYDLAPTTSTTAALAVGDALAVALLEEKGFKREDFARLHPGGSIGRKLLVRVADVMLTDDLPLLPAAATMREAVVQLAERRGIVVVVDEQRRVVGVVTTGDLSRLMERTEDVFPVRVHEVMTRTPKTARADELASAVVYRMEKHGIMAMPVLDEDDTVVGVVHLHDLMRARVA
jgi:arabinose-5-phosphate isomerase